MASGRCHCGAIAYEIDGDTTRHALCHCADCQRCSGAPMVGWLAVPSDRITISGEPVTYASSEYGRRQFCGTCGAGMFYVNPVVLPGIVDVQSATLDDAGSFPPIAQIQVADRLAWMTDIDALPSFDRYPPLT